MSSAVYTLNIGPSGSFTGSTGGCSFSGTTTTRASGKNVFDIALTFGAAPCRQPNHAMSGIALSYPVAGGKRQLVIAGNDK